MNHTIFAIFCFLMLLQIALSFKCNFTFTTVKDSFDLQLSVTVLTNTTIFITHLTAHNVTRQLDNKEKQKCQKRLIFKQCFLHKSQLY